MELTASKPCAPWPYSASSWVLTGSGFSFPSPDLPGCGEEMVGSRETIWFAQSHVGLVQSNLPTSPVSCHRLELSAASLCDTAKLLCSGGAGPDQHSQIFWCQDSFHSSKLSRSQDFPGGPVAKTLSSQCKGPGFNPWSGNWIPHVTTKSWYRQINKQINTCFKKLLRTQKILYLGIIFINILN